MSGLGLGYTNTVETRGVCNACLCLGCGGVCGIGDVGDVGGEWVGCLVQGLGGWCAVMPGCVVTLDYLWRWQVQVYVYCVRRIPAHLSCTQCSILLHLIDTRAIWTST